MMKLDRTDKRILQALQTNARMSNQELAEQVGLSPSPCLRRVRQLEEAGVIERYVTLLNRSKLGLKLMALVSISMDRHTPERFNHFESIIQSYSEVLECNLITGQDADYILKIIVPDMEFYQEFLLGKLTRIEGVTGVHTSFVLRNIVTKTAVPLDHLSS
ncbi:MAG TPA: AsnC family transcriptional regulator [Gammaproteobacteria bacterium]|nr:AsnC family transcriptional regulator [Gammaproteobacteria bacterium]HCO60673.1 AsnC family transcriptional regulator [Porticoccaceae bacterium]